MKWVRKLHNWASIVVGIQFLVWLVSGIYFNLMDTTKAFGRTYKAHINVEIRLDRERLVDPSIVLLKYQPSVSIELIKMLGQPFYQLTHVQALYPRFKNKYTLVNAYTGKEFLIDEQVAAKIAETSYNGPGKISNVIMVDSFIPDYPKQQNSAWQIYFDDVIDTIVYVEANSGRIIGHSDEHKRFADIFFMLHFMDYGNNGSFNNIQNVIFAIAALWLALSGFIWSIHLGLKGKYNIRR
jgi:Na+-transporting NADH:ubiquinone oxidoreductase subunit F